MRSFVSLGLSNTYGDVQAIEEDGKYYLLLDDHSSTNSKEISKVLYELIEKEFLEED